MTIYTYHRSVIEDWLECQDGGLPPDCQELVPLEEAKSAISAERTRIREELETWLGDGRRPAAEVRENLDRICPEET